MLFALAVTAQEKSSRISPDRIGAQSEFGFIIPHRPHMKSLIKGHSPSFRLRAEWLSSGEKEWHKQYLRPSIGVEWQWIDLGNPEELGYANALYSYMRLPLNRGIRLSQECRMGIGLVHLSKKYEIPENGKNLAAGSQFNASIFLQYLLGIPLSNRLNLTTGIGITHFSNAAYQIPNLGMNIAALSLGLEWLSMRPEQSPEKFKGSKQENELVSFLSFGVNEDFPPGGPKYLALNAAGEYSRGISPRSSLLLRGDLFFNEAIRAAMNRRENTRVAREKAIQMGLAGGYGLNFGDFMLRIMMGAYIIDEYRTHGSIYHRIGMQQQISEHLVAALGLKTHFAKAHHFELGIGWKW